MSDLERRLIDCIAAGRPFTADDVTGEGRLTIDGEHAPNGHQNGIGALFRTQSQARRIIATGRVVASHAPHRKGGMIREWQATEGGRRWAQRLVDGA